MPVTITKAKVKEKEKPKLDVQVSEHIAELVDRMGDLEERLAAYNMEIEPLAEELLQIRKELLNHVDNQVPPDHTLTLAGQIYRVLFSARSWRREIKDIELVRKFLGNKLFMSLASVSLGSIDKYMPGDQQAQCIEKSQIGPRSYKIAKQV